MSSAMSLLKPVERHYRFYPRSSSLHSFYSIDSPSSFLMSFSLFYWFSCLVLYVFLFILPDSLCLLAYSIDSPTSFLMTHGLYHWFSYVFPGVFDSFLLILLLLFLCLTVYFIEYLLSSITSPGLYRWFSYVFPVVFQSILLVLLLSLFIRLLLLILLYLSVSSFGSSSLYFCQCHWFSSVSPDVFHAWLPFVWWTLT